MNVVVLFPAHPDNCDVCDGRGVVTLHALRWRDGAEFAARVGRIQRCPLTSGADLLRAEVEASDEPGGDAA